LGQATAQYTGIAVSQSAPVIMVMGPTASGKTELAVELAQRLPCDIVSVDSALVYRYMDIGTAKPAPEVLKTAPHRLIDILDPTESYSAARFAEDALREIEQIVAAGRIPLLVGGTMLYFRALQKGLSWLPAADSEIRRRLSAEAGERGWESLHERLTEVDPESAARIHPNDPQRIQRALEVFELTGRTMTELHAEGVANKFPYRAVKLALAPKDRGLLHERIKLRFERMLELGFVDEVRGLRARGDLNPDLPSMRAVGYRQVWDYLAGNQAYAEMVQMGIVATRQLAKRQLTWLRAEPDTLWFDPADGKTVDRILKALKIIS
jgi:tRNA dimethylallyltransferase